MEKQSDDNNQGAVKPVISSDIKKYSIISKVVSVPEADLSIDLSSICLVCCSHTAEAFNYVQSFSYMLGSDSVDQFLVVKDAHTVLTAGANTANDIIGKYLNKDSIILGNTAIDTLAKSFFHNKVRFLMPHSKNLDSVLPLLGSVIAKFLI